MNNTQQKQIQNPGEGQRGRQISNENCCPTLASSNAVKIQNTLFSPQSSKFSLNSKVLFPE